MDSERDRGFRTVSQTFIDLPNIGIYLMSSAGFVLNLVDQPL